MREILLKYPQWQKLYIDAMLEMDPQILKSTICAGRQRFRNALWTKAIRQTRRNSRPSEMH